MTTSVFQGLPYGVYQTRNGTFTADANGVITVVNPTGTALADLYNEQVVPFGTAPFANFRNLLDGGDFTVNPWQRNIPGLATSNVISTPISTTPTYFADRWFAVGGTGSAVLMSAISDTSIAGFSTSLKVQRQSSNGVTNLITFGQVLETPDAIRTQTQQITLSFWAKAGANFSAAASTIGVNLIYGTGTNQTAAQLISGSWTTQSPVFAATQVLTTSMVRYQFTGTVPYNATQLGVTLTFTPVGTALADDSFTVNGLQLELGSTATAFEHRDVQVELEIAQRYAWVTSEPATSVIVGAGLNTTGSAQVFYMATPVQFRSAPTVTVSAGTWKTNQAGVATACTISAGTTHTANAISVNGNSTGTAGQATLLQGGGGTGYILASADF